MVLSPFSRWSAPLNTAIPPEFPVKSAHIYGDSVQEMFRLGGPRDCPKSELMSLHLILNIGFLGVSLNLCPKISNNLLGIIENCEVLTGADFVFFVNSISRFRLKTGLKSRKI
jgi:hypothetical protein